MKNIPKEIWRHMPPKVRYTLFFILGCTIVAIACLSSCSALGRYPDNPAEEALEEVIKQETGIDLDLSPSSPEE